MVCLSDQSGAWRPLDRQSLTGLDWLNDDIDSLREAYETACRVMPEGATWQAITCGERRIGLLIHAPAKARGPRRAIIYFHGGGWIVGSPLTHADISAAFSATTGLAVISVDYRLAPKHVAPAPIEDGLAAIDYVLARDRGMSLILCGDSAGAAIALAVASAAGATVAGVAACYGIYGLLDSQSLHALGSRANGLDANCLARMWNAAHASDRASPYTIEAVSRAGNAPVYVLAGAQDPVLDDSMALAEALRASGRLAGLDVVPGEGHGFLHGGLAVPGVRAAYTRLAHWIGNLPLD